MCTCELSLHFNSTVSALCARYLQSLLLLMVRCGQLGITCHNISSSCFKTQLQHQLQFFCSWIEDYVVYVLQFCTFSLKLKQDTAVVTVWRFTLRCIILVFFWGLLSVTKHKLPSELEMFNVDVYRTVFHSHSRSQVLHL